MYESGNAKMGQDEELVDILMDLIIVSASLAKSINRALKQKQIKEGGNVHGQTQRTGHSDQRPAQRRRYD